jgi:dTDP-4-amino-4,6-dideoxygalactose transaminase
VLEHTDTQPIQLARPELPPLGEFADGLGAIWEGAYVSNFGAAARELERLCADYTGLEHVATAANADLALTPAIAALRLPPGTRAVVPSFTFPSTLHAVLWNGLTPVFADVDPASWCATPESIAGAVDPAPGLILGTHAFMAACDVAGLEAVARDTGAALVFDAAQAYATWIGDRHAGSFGDASVFSFSATKVVTCGEGGLAAFRDPEVAARFERLRSYGMRRDYEVVQPGLNAKLTELHAALGCLTVPVVEERVAARAALAERYRDRLGEALQACDPGVRPTPTQLVVDAGDRRDAAAQALADAHVETRTYFRPLHLMPVFAAIERGDLAVTERLGRSLLTLPLHGGMTPADVDRVCDVFLDSIG